MKYLSTPVNNIILPYSTHRWFLSLALLLFCLVAEAQTLPEPMVPYRLVNDFTDLLTEQEQITLNNKLLTFNNETSTQIYVVTYDDLQGYDIAEFGSKVGEKWGIGQAGKNNGLLILVSPANKKVTIQTGYGLEGAVPDAIAKRLVGNVITPSFRENNYYGGLDSATNVIMSLTRGEYSADDYLKGGELGGIAAGVFFLIFLIAIIISSFRSKRYYTPKHNIPWWMLMGSGSSRNSDWGSFTSGRGGFGGGGFSGGGGGGFGGFSGGGGGSFGGGGASGGW
ncbi:MAG: TPM domain-containing protein [Bacteroidales bacterium]|nr:TPM domain-containing protein [Bacteroidales bacterium]